MEKKWGTKKSIDLKKMCPQQKARSLAYAEPSKEVRAWMAASQQRILSRLAHEREKTWKNNSLQDLDSKLHHDTLIGQLKASEARNRIRQMRLQCHNFKMQEINLMIASQANVQSAVRLELLLAKEKQRNNADSLDQLQGLEKQTALHHALQYKWLEKFNNSQVLDKRMASGQRWRVEEILEDEKGLTIIRR